MQRTQDAGDDEVDPGYLPTPATAHRRVVRFYRSPAGQLRARRATDVLVLVPALAGLVALIILQPGGEFERSLDAFLASFPDWLGSLWGPLYDLFALWAGLLLVAVIASRRRAVVIEVLGSLLLGILLAFVATRLAAGSWPDLSAVTDSSDSVPFPAFRVAACAAVILSAGSHLIRPLRTLGRWMVGVGLAAALLGAAALPTGALAALAIALVACAAVRLALGTAVGRPGLDEVRAGLHELGVEARELEADARQKEGAFSVHGHDTAGRTLLVKIYGRDAYDDQLLTKFWRTVAYREGGPALGLSRGQAAEHEALVTLLARRVGAASLDLVTAGTTGEGDGVLVLRGDATPLQAVSHPTDEMLGEAWKTLSRLSEANIAHSRINPANVAVIDGVVGLTDFAGAVVSPTSDQLMADRAALLATTATVAGAERAVHVAITELGSDAVTELLPYLQPAAFDPSLRQDMKRAGLRADALLEQTSAAVAAEPPALHKLRRVTWGTLLQAALLLFAASAIASAATNVNVEELRQSFTNAVWGWAVLGFVVAQLPRVTMGIATLGSILARLRFGPVYAMQLAQSYLALALPSSLARMTISIRFFQRQGVPPASAVASGAIESFAGNAVQIVLLFLLLVFSEATLAFSLQGSGDEGVRTLLLILVFVAVACVAAIAAVPRLRHAITGPVQRWWPDIRRTLGTLRTPNKIGLVVGGNLATELLFATALGLFAHSFGSNIPITELLVINISISLLASFVPVPGGIGVVEWGLVVGLTAAGMTETSAFATVFLYRLSTFYLPPIWGFFALRWLQKNRYL